MYAKKTTMDYVGVSLMLLTFTLLFSIGTPIYIFNCVYHKERGNTKLSVTHDVT